MSRNLLAYLVAALLAFFSLFISNWGNPVDPEAPTTAARPESQSFTVSLAGVQALGLPTQSGVYSYLNSFGTVETRNYSGVRLEEVLEALGAKMYVLNSGSTVRVTSSDGASAVYTYAMLLEYKTILAFDGSSLRAVVDGAEAAMWIKNVVTLTVNY